MKADNSDTQLTVAELNMGQTQEKLSTFAAGIMQSRHQVLLTPAVTCFRSLALKGHNWSLLDWDNVVQYLLRVPQFPVVELEPLFREQLQSGQVS